MDNRLLYWQRSKLIFGSTLSARDTLTLLAISDHLGSSTQCWPSVARLQARTRQSHRTVLRSLQSLEESGVLLVSRSAGTSNRYSIDMAWLEGHQCQNGTSANVTPVSEWHTHQCQSDTGGVSQRHGTSATVTPKGDQEENQEGNQGRKSGGKSQRSRKSLSITDVQAIVPPAALTDALPEYRQAFNQWTEVRKGTSWRQKPAQTESFHQKMLQAHLDGLDVMDALARAFDSGWQGINPTYMKPRTQKRAIKPAPALTDYRAQYLRQLQEMK